MTDSRAGKPRLLSMDIIRVAAIIMVVFQHACPFDYPSGAAMAWHLANGAAVNLLFMVSGALLLPVGEGYGAFYLRRLLKVGVPFMVWTVIYMLFHRYFDGWSDDEMSLAARRLFYKPSFPPGWFMYAIFGVYLMMPFVSPWIRTATRRQYHWFLGIWLASMTLPYLSVRYGAPVDGSGILGLFYNFMGFAVAGAYLLRFPFHGRVGSGAFWGVIAGLMVVWGCIIAIFYDYAFRCHRENFLLLNDLSLTTALLAIVIFSVVLTLCRDRRSAHRGGRVARVFKFLSVNSFGVYLVHYAVLEYLFVRYLPDFSQGWTATFGVLLVSLAVTVVLRHIPFIGRYLV